MPYTRAALRAHPFHRPGARALPHDGAHPRVRERGGGGEQGRRRRLRREPRRRRACAARCTCRPARRRWPPASARISTRTDSDHLDAPRPRPHARQGRRWSAMMCELFGRASGCNGGKGGSMHIADFSVGMLGANGVVAAGMPIAVGAAHALKLQRRARSRRLLLRRRRDQPRAVPRGAELGRDLRAAGAVRLRGQPLLGHHRDRGDDGRRGRARARAGDRHAGRARSTATMSRRSTPLPRRSSRKCAPGRARVPARDHLSREGPRVGRPGGVPRRRRGGAGARGRPARRSRPSKLAALGAPPVEVERSASEEVRAPRSRPRARRRGRTARAAYADVQDTGAGRWR